ncbi:MAG: helix-turn-helix domain-containing protein [Akkermansiaceae bacterium]|nr:helix-turn-helix domain-containing protein [Akkermansiaceae bacterium]MCP5547169.1 helix-turn-helix domain-containing protein [Akkermansiaceae bacterium]
MSDNSKTPLVYLNPAMGRLVFDEDSNSYFVSPFFSIDQAAAYLGVGVATVRTLVRDGMLSKRHSGQFPYHVDDLADCSCAMKFTTQITDKVVQLTTSGEALAS